MRARASQLFLASLWMLIAASSSPATTEQMSLRSRSYEITTTLERDMARQVAVHMDLAHAYYSDRFAGFRSRQLQQHPLHVFATRQGYLDFLATHDINGAGSSGMFFVSRKGSGLATFLEDQGLSGMLRTLRHEGFHQFAHSKIGPNLPQWVNEGMAEYFAEAIVVEGRFTPGHVSPAALQNVQRAVAEDDFIPFEELLNLSTDAWGERVRNGDARLLYDQSWSMVHFLVHADPRYRAAFESYLAELGRGHDSRRAFNKAFNSPDYAAFERAWKQYVENLEPTPETTAALRLRFLGEGLRLLHERDVAVESIDHLQTLLRAGEFRMRISFGHGLSLEMRADEDEHFQPPEPRRRGREASLELIAAEDDLPPRLVVRGLQHTVRLDWQRGGDGEPISEINYE